MAASSEQQPMYQLVPEEIMGQCNRVLLCGCGGGYDVYSAIPLFYALKARGKQVFLGSNTFIFLDAFSSPPLSSAHLPPVSDETPLTYVCADSTWPPGGKDDYWGEYFPEFYLTHWFKKVENQDVPIFMFRGGVRQLRSAMQTLVDALNVDTVIIVDGGTDSLMSGDEPGLGTPTEDLACIVAASRLTRARSFLSCVGFGLDTFHGVEHYYVLKAIAEVTRARGYLGLHALLPQSTEFQKSRSLQEYINTNARDFPSIVCSSVLDAADGHFGDHRSNPRTGGSELFINPLMSIYWYLTMEAVASRMQLREALEGTTTIQDVQSTIEAWRKAKAAKGEILDHHPTLKL
ncbi:cell surface glycoprotein [Pelomyxa schiedti]|nr:cell surface glycoprotein [Pelomyxa schiedti]